MFSMTAVGCQVILFLAGVRGGFSAELVDFELRDAGQTQRMKVILDPDRLRVDLPAQKFSVIYVTATTHFTGLEHRDAHYWEFDWNRVSEEAEKSRRAGARFNDLLIQGLAGYDNQPQDSKTVLPEETPVMWKPDGTKKTIAGKMCDHWNGEMPGLKMVGAWVTSEPVPALTRVLDRLKPVNEPLAVAAVRPLVAPEVFIVVDALRKAEVVPLEVEWGDARSPSRLTFLGSHQEDMNPGIWAPPATYAKTDLVALDGILEEKK